MVGVKITVTNYGQNNRVFGIFFLVDFLLAHLAWAFTITWRPSPSVRPTYVVNFNLLLRNHLANCNQTFVEWSLDGPLPKLCPVIPTSNQDYRQAKNRKGGMKLKKNFSSETTEPISTKLKWFLGGPLPKLCPMIPTSNQDGRQAKNRKKGGWNFNCPLLL